MWTVVGSKESVGVKFKEGVYAKVLVWQRRSGIFVVLLSQDGFESDSPEKVPQQSLPKVTLEAAVRGCPSK